MRNRLTGEFSLLRGYLMTLLTISVQIRTGHRSELLLCIATDSNLDPFFCCSNVTYTVDSFVLKLGSEWNIKAVLLKNLMFFNWSILVLRSVYCVSVLVLVYSQDRIAKKRAPDTSWETAISVSDLVFSLIKRKIRRGVHDWRRMFGCWSLYPLSYR